MIRKAVSIGVLVALGLALGWVAATAFNKPVEAAPVKEPSTFTDKQATDHFIAFVQKTIGDTGVVLGANCIGQEGDTYGCIIALGVPGTQEVAECDLLVVKIPYSAPDVNVTIIESKTTALTDCGGGA